MKKLILMLALLPLLADAETIPETIRNINKAFYSEDKLALGIETHVYRDRKEQPGEPALMVYRLNSSFLYKTDDTESLLNGSYLVNVDHKRKMIVISPPLKGQPGVDPVKMFSGGPGLTKALDSLLSFYKHVSIKSINETTSELTFEFKSGAYESVSVQYDVSSYRTESISVYMRPVQEGSRNEKHQYHYLIKNNYQPSGAVSKAIFSESNYFTIRKDQVVPAARYKSYVIINNITKKSKSA